MIIEVVIVRKMFVIANIVSEMESTSGNPGVIFWPLSERDFNSSDMHNRGV